MTNAVIILAAGQGTRMCRDGPKVLQMLGGQPMLQRVLDTAHTLEAMTVHVVGHSAHNEVQALAKANNAVFNPQTQQQGTANAVQCADTALDAEQVLILYGDVPLLRQATLQKLMARLQSADLAVLTAIVNDPDGYGRIVRDAQGHLQKIVEQRDASEDEKTIREINTGIIVAKGKVLRRLLQQVKPDNTQHEYYLTDCIGLAVQEKLTVQTQVVKGFSEAQGVNTMMDLEHAERYLQCRLAEELMQSGCVVRDKHRLDIRGQIEVGAQVEIDVNVLFEGKVVLGDGVCIGANCVLKDVVIESGTVVKPFSSIEASRIGKDCVLGPYARIRPQVQLKDGVKVGNFVELKKTTIDRNSKVNHLSYIGDSQVGKDVNIGAGTITCNYDGVRKHGTIIGDNVFIGAGTQLVAPVEVEDGATIGAGSTITRNAEGGKLTLSRSEQKTIQHWKRATKENK